MPFRPLAPTLALSLVLAAASVAAAEAPTMDATATIAAPVMPAPKAGGKELEKLFDGAPGDVLAADCAAEWRDLNAFRELVPAGGDYVLTITLTRAGRDFEDRRDAGADLSPLKVDLHGDAAWARRGQPVVSVPIDLTRKISVDHGLTKDDLREAWRALFREVAQRAIAGLYERTGGASPGG